MPQFLLRRTSSFFFFSPQNYGCEAFRNLCEVAVIFRVANGGKKFNRTNYDAYSQ